MATVSENYKPTGKEVPFGGGRFLLSHRLGNGSFGDIFEGYDKKSNRIVAVKLERKKARYPQLSYESKVYRVLHQPPVGQNEVNPRQLFVENSTNSIPANSQQSVSAIVQQHRKSLESSIVVGIPQIYYFDSEGDYNIMVMEMCGPSLEDVFNYCHRRFSIKTVLMIADQLLHRIQYFHEKGFVHRDIKPENFVLGCRSKAHILYIIDYGLSKLYWEVKKNSHIPFVEGRPLTGTARYCSTNVHRGFEQGRRDDLESIGFLFIYFLRGSLPWQGIQAKDQQIKTIKIGETKMATPLEELCKGVPKEFLKYFQYCRSLSFAQKPDYDSLRHLFLNLGKRLGLTLPAPDPPSGNFCAANRTGAKPSNPLTAPAMSFADITSPTDSRLPSVVSGTTVNSRPSHALQTPNTVAAPVLPNLEDVDLMRGPYDWCFDWFCKRQMEVKKGMEEQLRRQRLETQSSVITPRNGELCIEDISDVGDGSMQRDKSSALGSKRPMFSSPLQADHLRM